MTNSTDLFETWLAQQAANGHPRDWLRNNAPALRQRFERDTSPLEVPMPPRMARVDRYEEL